MRVLIDANLSPRIAEHLRRAGHDALHVADLGLLSATDFAIVSYAAAEARVIVTSDSDFGSILARTGGDTPSVVLLRHHHHALPEDQLKLIEAALQSAAEELAAGAIATISRGRLRVRRLPIA